MNSQELNILDLVLLDNLIAIFGGAAALAKVMGVASATIYRMKRTGRCSARVREEFYRVCKEEVIW